MMGIEAGCPTSGKRYNGRSSFDLRDEFDSPICGITFAFGLIPSFQIQRASVIEPFAEGTSVLREAELTDG